MEGFNNDEQEYYKDLNVMLEKYPLPDFPPCVFPCAIPCVPAIPLIQSRPLVEAHPVAVAAHVFAEDHSSVF